MGRGSGAARCRCCSCLKRRHTDEPPRRCFAARAGAVIDGAAAITGAATAIAAAIRDGAGGGIGDKRDLHGCTTQLQHTIVPAAACTAAAAAAAAVVRAVQRSNGTSGSVGATAAAGAAATSNKRRLQQTSGVIRSHPGVKPLQAAGDNGRPGVSKPQARAAQLSAASREYGL